MAGASVGSGSTESSMASALAPSMRTTRPIGRSPHNRATTLPPKADAPSLPGGRTVHKGPDGQGPGSAPVAHGMDVVSVLCTAARSTDTTTSPDADLEHLVGTRGL